MKNEVNLYCMYGNFCFFKRRFDKINLLSSEACLRSVYLKMWPIFIVLLILFIYVLDKLLIDPRLLELGEQFYGARRLPLIGCIYTFIGVRPESEWTSQVLSRVFFIHFKFSIFRIFRRHTKVFFFLFRIIRKMEKKNIFHFLFFQFFEKRKTLILSLLISNLHRVSTNFHQFYYF